MKLIFLNIFFLFFFTSRSQTYIVKDIKSFGAKGNGKTNDQAAFKKAADYFNQRGGNGKLIIPKGIYILGNQVFMGGQLNKPAYQGEDVLHFTNIKNFSIEGVVGSILKYKKGLRFGAFSPATGKVYEHGNNYFVNRSYAAILGSCIAIENCSNIQISLLSLDGNNQNILLGGVYGDVGRQIPHNGIYILNSNSISINKITAHHFGLDGIIISNKESNVIDSIRLTNCIFEYNSRQGLSWVGGNQLYVKNCKFNHTGREKFSSPPGAGVDIEAEVGPVRNGVFENCEFIDNKGCGLVADSGNSGDCTFLQCTFWGTTSWSIWITKPGISFYNCKIYGSIVHGYNSPSIQSATKFYNCSFEDKLFKANPPYGQYLVETNDIKRMLFFNCSFISNIKKICWFNSSASSIEEKYQLTNCSFTVNNMNLPFNDFVGIIRGAALKNCTFTFTDPDTKKKKYYLGGYGEASNADLGGNKVIFR
ncbi:MAG: right-handed parallel beta-helix repeat-containing protein [Ginsengibacter sp.]